MNPTNLTKSSEEQREFEPDILNIGIGVVAGFAIAYLLKKKRSIPLWKDKTILPIKPPPIIIKSGSFIFETDEKLIPNTANMPNYTRNFGNDGIKGIRVTFYSEQIGGAYDRFFSEGEDWAGGESIEVIIEIQLCIPVDGICTSWNNIPSKKIKILVEGNVFKIETEIPISASKRNKKNYRQFKHEDEYNNEFSRFKRVIINNKSTGEKIEDYDRRDDREFIIGFYNE